MSSAYINSRKQGMPPGHQYRNSTKIYCKLTKARPGKPQYHLETSEIAGYPPKILLHVAVSPILRLVTIILGSYPCFDIIRQYIY